MKWKRKAKEKTLWRMFVISLFLIFLLFVIRIRDGDAMTDVSNREIIKLSGQYSMGAYYDRNMEEIETDDEYFQKIFGVEELNLAKFKKGIVGVSSQPKYEYRM